MTATLPSPSSFAREELFLYKDYSNDEHAIKPAEYTTVIDKQRSKIQSDKDGDRPQLQ